MSTPLTRSIRRSIYLNRYRNKVPVPVKFEPLERVRKQGDLAAESPKS